MRVSVANGQFTIMTNATHVEVSWQITAVRQDAYAKAHPFIVEEAKGERERGYYLNPELYGQPKERQTEWARHPAAMRRTQTLREAQRARTARGVRLITAANQSSTTKPITRLHPDSGKKATQAQGPVEVR